MLTSPEHDVHARILVMVVADLDLKVPSPPWPCESLWEARHGADDASADAVPYGAVRRAGSGVKELL